MSNKTYWRIGSDVKSFVMFVLKFVLSTAYWDLDDKTTAIIMKSLVLDCK